jgi:hypothetical protein
VSFLARSEHPLIWERVGALLPLLSRSAVEVELQGETFKKAIDLLFKSFVSEQGIFNFTNDGFISLVEGCRNRGSFDALLSTTIRGLLPTSGDQSPPEAIIMVQITFGSLILAITIIIASGGDWAPEVGNRVLSPLATALQVQGSEPYCIQRSNWIFSAYFCVSKIDNWLREKTPLF